ncbi:Putative glycoside hydrolase family 31, galactose mutarotase-like domain superfamily [Septoria linicola]|uniref:alpha-glucosidase n=1 Tax=Septoria linicola TaxID=215465 RepID=A0A9Q9EQY7_9PEZI|nr:Putative glycoside hydrolase family 31, galactose mutarotase-like domain superfamily [Septoria linicola]
MTPATYFEILSSGLILLSRAKSGFDQIGFRHSNAARQQPFIPDTSSDYALADAPSLPTVIPTVYDPSAPQPQEECPGYKARSVAVNDHGFSAYLAIAGPPCGVFGNDIADLTLEVSHQTRSRLSVKIQPTYISKQNSSQFILNDQFVAQPHWDGQTTSSESDLQFDWSNSPSFQFSISRRQSGEVLFSTYGHRLVFEDQFLELVTNMVDDYNVYGLAETVRDFRFGTNFNATLFNVDSADATDSNSYGSHPFYQETRYNDGKNSTAHGLYARNAHAQEWLLREKTLTYRTIGGSVDLYFFSGQSEAGPDMKPTALNVIRQYQQSVGYPAMQAYWAHGFHQCHWGWGSVQDLSDVVSKYKEADVSLEAIWTDLDVYYRARPLTNDENKFPSAAMHEFVASLREKGQHYVPLVDSNVYYPDPENTSDVYLPFTRGDTLKTFIRDGSSGDYFIGKAWPGKSVWADWLIPSSQEWFSEELRIMNEATPYDGIWIDVNEPSNFDNVLVTDDEGLNSVQDSRKLNFPPYRINNFRSSHQIIDGTIPMNAVHNDDQATREYDVHNLWSVGMSKAAYTALATAVHPGKRPFIISRSTGIGSGQWAGHWGGDNESKWGALYLSISQALIFQMSGVPMFGTDTCGFGGPSPSEELCARWFELNAFFPFYRNHYGVMRPAQEAYAWPSVTEAARRAMAVRYSLLTYMYTLFFFAHTRGDTVLRALAWEFPNDESLRATDNQFMLGSALLITPVLTEGATSVKGVLPGLGDVERWYDWYTLAEVTGIKSARNITMSAPLEHINLHMRGGHVLALQEPGYTTRETREGRYSIIVALDSQDKAHGTLYLDDGESVEQDATKLVQFDYADGKLSVSMDGQYHAAPSLASITIAGLAKTPKQLALQKQGAQHSLDDFAFANQTLRVAELDQYFSSGAWEHDFVLNVL